MARVATLRERVEKIVRKYKRVNAHKYLYNTKGDLKRRYKSIKVWYLIHDETRGYSIISLDFKRREPMSIAEWTRLHRERVGNYNSLYNVFTQAILPAINNKGGNSWTFKSLLAWTGNSDLHGTKHSDSSKGRNKAAKKRRANAR